MKIINKLKKRFLNTPEYASAQGWWKYETETKAEKPVLYFLLEIIPDTTRRLWFRKVVLTIKELKAKYYYKSHHVKVDVVRFSKTNRLGKHVYHMGHDILVLYSTFQILVDTYEANIDDIEDLKNHPSVARSKKWCEIEELYKWWTVDRMDYENSLIEPIHADYGLSDNFWGTDDDGVENRDKLRFNAYMIEKDRINTLREEFEIKIKEMLIRCTVALSQ